MDFHRQLNSAVCENLGNIYFFHLENQVEFSHRRQFIHMIALLLGSASVDLMNCKPPLTTVMPNEESCMLLDKVLAFETENLRTKSRFLLIFAYTHEFNGWNVIGIFMFY